MWSVFSTVNGGGILGHIFLSDQMGHGELAGGLIVLHTQGWVRYGTFHQGGKSMVVLAACDSCGESLGVVHSRSVSWRVKRNT